MCLSVMMQVILTNLNRVTRSIPYAHLVKPVFPRQGRSLEYDMKKDVRANERYRQMEAKGIRPILYGKQYMNGFSETAFEQMYRGA